MYGVLFLIPFNDRSRAFAQHELPLTLALERFVGGRIEPIDLFDTVEWDGIHRCVAYRKADGPSLPEEFNKEATWRWWDALVRAGLMLEGQPVGDDDFLHGNVVVLFGDEEFMACV